MPEARPSRRPQPSLFAQIAVRLAVLTLVFAVLDVGIVVANYALDDDAMAEDFVGQQARRVEQVWRSGAAGELDAPLGVSAWGYAVVDHTLRPVSGGGDPRLVSGGAWSADADVLDWTRRDRVDGGVRVSGVRRFDGPSGPHWVLVAVETQGRLLNLPVIGVELLDHVVAPLIPLTVLLLVFNVVVVRRMLAPLSAAAAEVDALDPTRMDARLAEPAGSREVAALVAAVNRALDRLQQAMSLLKAFTADAAHELRTPLSVLKLRLEALPEDEAKRRLREDVDAMTRLVNQMLDLSQADALHMDHAGRIDLRTVAREVVAQTAPLAFAAGHDIRLVDQDPAPMRGHPEALARALRNLVDNAIHHAGGDGPIEVIVGPGARLAVRDHGRGLATTDPEVLFRRFWRKRRERSGGAGLGLGIARSIVEAHGGVISAHNAPDGGALFTCEFPALPLDPPPPAAEPAPAAVAHG